MDVGFMAWCTQSYVTNVFGVPAKAEAGISNTTAARVTTTRLMSPRPARAECFDMRATLSRPRPFGKATSGVVEGEAFADRLEAGPVSLRADVVVHDHHDVGSALGLRHDE